MKFLIDTNFLLIPGRFRVDVFKELERFGRPELLTIDLVVSELRKLASGKGRNASHARLGLDLIEKKGIRVLESQEGSADHEIERLASEQDLVVCTQDRELQERLRREGLSVVSLRQKRYLEKA
jgi:rRNA-processing protein FCF1